MRKMRATPPKGKSTRAVMGEAKPAPPTKWKPVRVSFVIAPELLERARNAAYALRVLEPPPTLAGLLEDGARHEVEQLEKKHHKGRPFPARPERKLRPGRRVGG
jgi:hypothetical protein